MSCIANPPERPFRLSISYAHENGAVKDRLKLNLAPLQRNGLAQIVDDRAIPAGTGWPEEIATAMAGADAALFLLDEYFLASGFCKDVETIAFLQRQHDEGVLILFIVADHCCWKNFDYINKYQLIPRDGHPITSYLPHSRAYTHITDEIVNALARHQPKPRAAQTLPAQEQGTGTTGLTALLAKLPGATSHLFGRDAELAQINFWKAHQGVLLWVAEGGTGKSALVRKWLERQRWPEGTRFLGHSFCSQSNHTSSRSFLLDALKQLNAPHDARAADDELGGLLAETVALEPAVLVLDGIETLQQPAENARFNGMIKDCGLTALLEGLARKPGQSLCLASSRLPIPEARIADEKHFRQKMLGLLPPDAARALLRQRGMRGEDAGFGGMAERCGRHPLTLVLATEFCHTFLQGHAAEFLKHASGPETENIHAATVMAWFDSALADEHQALDRELVRILGLFDRPAPWGALLALKAAKAISGLTVALHAADEPAILKSLARLSQWGLLNADLTRREPELDAHPLVREHFGALLEKDAHKAWQAGHSVLFDWFCSLPDKEQPDTPEELEPLYRAVGHGCKAGRYRAAQEVIYLSRILRGNIHYTQNQPGVYSSDLGALAGFFPQGWSQPPVAANAGLPDEALSEANRTKLLSDTAFTLKSLGRLEDALGPQRIGHQRTKESGDWNNFCRSAENLVSLLTPLGRWIEAEAVSREAVGAANCIEDKEERWQRTTTALAYLGHTLHGRGYLKQASTAYALAEMVQAEAHHHPKLYSIYGYNYAQLLLEQASQEAGWREVLARRHTSLDIAMKLNHPLSQALDHGAIGFARAALGEPDTVPALDLAVTTMQRAGAIIHLPAMHLARAHYQRSLHDPAAAWTDFDAAQTIARRSNMRTYLAECALLGGNLCLDEARVPEAAAQYASAAQLIREDGYGRRLAELHLLHARLLHAQRDPAAPQALADAQTRIREAGQWYFWRELRAVANEIAASDPGECPACGN